MATCPGVAGSLGGLSDNGDGGKSPLEASFGAEGLKGDRISSWLPFVLLSDAKFGTKAVRGRRLRRGAVEAVLAVLTLALEVIGG